MRRHKDYFWFFRQIAEKHVDILHSEVEADNRFRFARLILTTDPFPALDIQEFIGSIRSRLPEDSQAFMLCQSPTNDYSLNGDQWHKLHTGAFMIMKKFEAENYDDRDQKIDDCEGIAEDILAYMHKYFADNLPDYVLKETMISGEPIGPVEGVFIGVRVDFKYDSLENGAFFYNTDKWTE